MAIQKICVTGGVLTDVGKTTVAKHLKAHMKRRGMDVQLVGVEASDKAMDCEDRRILPEVDPLYKLWQEFGILDDEEAIIVDVGGEFFSDLMRVSKSFGGNFETEFDLFVIPISPSHKIEGIMRAVSDLVERGIDTSKLAIVFNRVEMDREKHIQDDFSKLLDYANKNKVRVCKNFVHVSKMIEARRGKDCVYDKLVDEAEIKAMISEAKLAKDIDAALKLGAMRVDGKWASVDAAAYDRVFNEILGE